MEKARSTNEEIFDLLLRDAYIEKCKRDVELLKENAKSHEFSPEFEKKIKKIARSIGKDKRIENLKKSAYRFVTAFAYVISISFSVLLTQPKVYAAVQEVIRSIFSTHDQYTYQNDNSDLTFDNSLRLGYIPDGYELRSGFYSTSNVSLTYVSPDGKNIYFDYGLAENSLVMIDNEDNNYIELKNNDIDYYFYESQNLEDDLSVLLWYSNGYFYSINAQLQCDEIMEIAENIK